MATEEKLTRKERRQRWKAAQKAKKEEKKEYYRYAPWGKRVWNLYLKKPLGILLVIVILAKPAIAALRDYEWQRRKGKLPAYRGAANGVKDTDFWQD